MKAGLHMCPSISADRNEMNLLATTNAVVCRGQNGERKAVCTLSKPAVSTEGNLGGRDSLQCS